MGEQTGINWCDSSWSPWIGCQKVSVGCDHCFAENLMDTRHHRVTWGQRKTESTAPSVGTRSRTSADYWKQPLRWNKNAEAFQAKHGHRQRVFPSLCDPFDNQVDPQWRVDMWDLIWRTPNLDWLILTKRPENIEDMLPESWSTHREEWRNVWLGVSCEDQPNYDRRWPILARVPHVAVKWISYEPACGPLEDLYATAGQAPDWLICGGETGPGWRDMPEAWVEEAMALCQDAGVPFYMKQMANRRPIPHYFMVRETPRYVP